MKILALCAFPFISISGFSQQDPIYSQYLLNPIEINPAYARLNNNLTALAGYRTQWAGYDRQPQTLNATAHTSIVSNKIGIGIAFMNDRNGNAITSFFESYHSLFLIFNFPQP